jgi:mannose/cellobiose epimerase-like protein (N-acyl-D-glucosamine 2-epimerase family)
VPEHFTADWTPLPDYNADHRDDRFRPYGTTPGHAFEWSRLILGVEASLPDAPGWLAEASVALFDRAFTDAWDVDGHAGFVYTIGHDGEPIVRARMHWVACEAVLAAEALHRRTGNDGYAHKAALIWAHIANSFLDEANGGWWNELTPDLRPAHTVWPGKPDLYHSYQALVFPDLPAAPSAAAALARGLRVLDV